MKKNHFFFEKICVIETFAVPLQPLLEKMAYSSIG